MCNQDGIHGSCIHLANNLVKQNGNVRFVFQFCVECLIENLLRSTFFVCFLREFIFEQPFSERAGEHFLEGFPVTERLFLWNVVVCLTILTANVLFCIDECGYNVIHREEVAGVGEVFL